MIFKRISKDEEIIQLLKKMKNAESDYPADLLKNQRSAFLSAATGLSLVAPSLGLLKGRLHFLSHISAKTLEVILISTLMVTTILDVYLYRDEIANWFKSQNPTPITSYSTLNIQPNLISTATRTQTITPTPTTTGTIFFTQATIENTPAIIKNTPATIQNTPTTIQYTPTKPGYHYGQTKTPKP